jgi:hypothetical protein
MLKYPLTLSAILEEFKELAVAKDSVETYGTPRGSEAAVNGSWFFTKLRQLFAAKGYQKIPEKDGVRFVNDDQTVGIVCVGHTPDPHSNRWKTYSFELQARTLNQARAGAPGRAPLISL